MDRRHFVRDLARLSALAATTPSLWRLRWRPAFAGDPFTLGVASGDPTASSVVLWTRLAPTPLDPLGGLGGERPVVRWELADDDKFSRIVKRGAATATPELAYSVHVDVGGLRPGRWYHYRFMSGDAVSETGRVCTAPDTHDQTPFSFTFLSCQHYEQGLYTALHHMSEEDVHLAVHLGDYIYETAAPAPGQMGNRVRAHVGPNIHTLDDYRQRYALYKSDPALRRAHAHYPWLLIWDDHEVDNNYANLINELPAQENEAVMRVRRAGAYQAWYEHQPVRLKPIAHGKSWTDYRIYRTLEWGPLARFYALDGRQYRTDQPCGDGSKAIPCDGYDAPGQTMLGAAQEQWLYNGLAHSHAQWQVLANQVVFSPPDEPPKAGDRVQMDNWHGYPAARDRALAAIATHAPGRTVVLTGDIHDNWVYDVRRGFDARDRPVIATEFVGTSISSGGDGSDTIARVTPAYLAANPSLKWANDRRGYVRCTVSESEWRADYRVVPFVSQPDAPVKTASSWRTERGQAGVQKI
ncbi:MAG TPA: alkaline phosphatase D family protein [Gemmatimonadaceae bacterium]|nr:alkaline phosphatase D family protein [Gemmatimonadaceae bacterium]